MQRDKRDIEASLKMKGFSQDDRDHHVFIYYTRKGLRTRVRTKTSHGSSKMKSVGDSLLNQMAKQCYLEKGQFLDLVDCPLGRDDFESILQGKGLT